MPKAVTDPVYRHRLLQLAADACWSPLRTGSPSPPFRQRHPGSLQDLLCHTIFRPVGKVAIFAAFGLYHKWWRYVGLRDFEAILRAAVVASLVMVGVLFSGLRPT